MKNFEEKFHTLLLDKLKINSKELKADVKFIDLGVDSIDMIELIIEFEYNFFITIPDEDADNFITIGDAELYLKTRLNIA